MAPKSNRRAYSVEELFALRRSASEESAVAIKRRAEDRTIKGEIKFFFSGELHITRVFT